MVSVILPVYNSAGTLRECIESVLSQTLRDFELIAVDDGSSDESLQILEEFSRRDRRVKVLRRSHRGIVSALNDGLKEARGEFVARMDADDLMHPSRLEAQLQWMEENPGVSLCGCLVEVDSLEGELSSGVLRYRDWSNSLVTHEQMVREIFVESPIVHPTFFGRRELFLKLSGYRDVPWAEDYDFILRAYLSGHRFGKVGERLLLWRDRSDRLVRVDERCKRKAMFRAKVHYFLELLGDRKIEIAVAGTGPSGRMVAESFMERDVRISFFIDNRESPPGRKVMGIDAYGFPGEIPSGFLYSRRNVHYVLCVGEEEGRKMLIRQLKEAGFKEGENYTRFL